jgi:hypothetical protein
LALLLSFIVITPSCISNVSRCEWIADWPFRTVTKY